LYKNFNLFETLVKNVTLAKPQSKIQFYDIRTEYIKLDKVTHQNMYCKCSKFRGESKYTELNPWEVGGTALRSKTQWTER